MKTGRPATGHPVFHDARRCGSGVRVLPGIAAFHQQAERAAPA